MLFVTSDVVLGYAVKIHAQGFPVKRAMICGKSPQAMTPSMLSLAPYGAEL